MLITLLSLKKSVSLSEKLSKLDSTNDYVEVTSWDAIPPNTDRVLFFVHSPLTPNILPDLLEYLDGNYVDTIMLCRTKEQSDKLKNNYTVNIVVKEKSANIFLDLIRLPLSEICEKYCPQETPPTQPPTPSPNEEDFNPLFSVSQGTDTGFLTSDTHLPEPVKSVDYSVDIYPLSLTEEGVLNTSTKYHVVLGDLTYAAKLCLHLKKLGRVVLVNWNGDNLDDILDYPEQMKSNLPVVGGDFMYQEEGIYIQSNQYGVAVDEISRQQSLYLEDVDFIVILGKWTTLPIGLDNCTVHFPVVSEIDQVLNHLESRPYEEKEWLSHTLGVVGEVGVHYDDIAPQLVWGSVNLDKTLEVL